MQSSIGLLGHEQIQLSTPHGNLAQDCLIVKTQHTTDLAAGHPYETDMLDSEQVCHYTMVFHTGAVLLHFQHIIRFACLGVDILRLRALLIIICSLG